MPSVHIASAISTRYFMVDIAFGGHQPGLAPESALMVRRQGEFRFRP